MDDKIPDENLTEEFRNLGKNFFRLLQSAWESPERKRMQGEIATGLTELRATLEQELSTFNESPTGKRLKADVEDVRQRIRSGEAEMQMRQELISAMQALNNELKKASENLSQTQPGEEPKAAPGPSETAN